MPSVFGASRGAATVMPSIVTLLQCVIGRWKRGEFCSVTESMTRPCTCEQQHVVILVRNTDKARDGVTCGKPGTDSTPTSGGRALDSDGRCSFARAMAHQSAPLPSTVPAPVTRKPVMLAMRMKRSSLLKACERNPRLRTEFGPPFPPGVAHGLLLKCSFRSDKRDPGLTCGVKSGS